MSTEYEAAAEVRDALLALKAEFAGELSIGEQLGVCAAQMIVNGDLLKRILVELQAINATTQGRD
jgi:hypothetical protein